MIGLLHGSHLDLLDHLAAVKNVDGGGEGSLLRAILLCTKSHACDERGKPNATPLVLGLHLKTSHPSDPNQTQDHHPSPHKQSAQRDETDKRTNSGEDRGDRLGDLDVVELEDVRPNRSKVVGEARDLDALAAERVRRPRVVGEGVS